jgi:hypothetical protein
MTTSTATSRLLQFHYFVTETNVRTSAGDFVLIRLDFGANVDLINNIVTFFSARTISVEQLVGVISRRSFLVTDDRQDSS